MTQPKLKIKKGDQVVVLTGKDKGARGEVLRVIPAKARVVVAGVNMATHHKKPTQTAPGGIQRIEASLHISNVAIADPKTGVATRVGYKTLEDGEKIRGDDKIMQPRYKDLYDKEIVPALAKEFGHKNPHAIAKLTKIVLNMGVGEASQDRKHITNAANDLGLIAGQKPIITKARQSNASFKIREGMAIGTKVTLRGTRMYEFLDRLITVALPRVRDFRGVSAKSFDGRGNYALGITEHIIFPEIDYDKVDKVRGMDIVICTNAKTDAEARALLRGFFMPFKK